MKRILRRYDLESCIPIKRAPFSGELDRSFIGPGPTVGKKYPVDTGALHNSAILFPETIALVIYERDGAEFRVETCDEIR
jgi:hypothetical protein